jgi:hypothetical protein
MITGILTASEPGVGQIISGIPSTDHTGIFTLGVRIESFDRPSVEKCNSATINVTHFLSDFQYNKANFFLGLGVGAYRAIKEDTVLRVASICGTQGLLLTSVEGVNIGRVGFYPERGSIIRIFG